MTTSGKVVNQMSEKEYRAFDAVSYSSLSSLAVSPRSFIADQSGKGDTSYTILGSVVDILLTDKRRFDDDVYVMTVDKPNSEMMLKYCETLAETGDSTKAFQASGYKQNPQATSKFDKEGKPYYEAILAGRGKMIIGADDFFKANQIVETLKANKFTKGYFVEDSENVELIFQMTVPWGVDFEPIMGGEVEMMKLKSMVDVVHIDHANGVITPVDLKTGGEGFFKSYWKYKRYLQAAMYTDAIRTFPWGEWKFNDNRMDHYAVAPLKFIYADTNLINPPVIYCSTEEDITVGRYGRSYQTIRGIEIPERRVKGYIELIRELDWHRKMDQWDYSYDDYENIGERQIDAFSIKL